jgi:hypothetical protein
MGAQYRLTHVSTNAGTTTRSYNQLEETLTYTASWFIRSVQESIVKSEMYRNNHQYMYFVLVHCSPEKIMRLRKLNVGPKISAGIIEKHRDSLTIQARETNGVEATLTDYIVTIVGLNRHARLISLFAWKVSESTIRHMSGVFEKPIVLNANDRIISIPNPNPCHSIASIIIGAQFETAVTLNGYDEVGRKISVVVK